MFYIENLTHLGSKDFFMNIDVQASSVNIGTREVF